MTERANWREGAACRTADPELFFPVGTTGPALLQIDQAKRICQTCPAQTQCRAGRCATRSPTAYGAALPKTSGAPFAA